MAQGARNDATSSVRRVQIRGLVRSDSQGFDLRGIEKLIDEPFQTAEFLFSQRRLPIELWQDVHMRRHDCNRRTQFMRGVGDERHAASCSPPLAGRERD